MSNKLTKNELHEDIVQTLDKVQVATNDIVTLSNNISTHKSDETSNVYYADDTGTANAKVVAVNPAPSTYKKGLGISFTNLAQNTSIVTINVNGLGAKLVLKSNGSSLTSGNLKAGSVYTVRYNGTSFILQGEGGEYGTAEAPQVLSGYTVGRETGIVSGAIANLGAIPVNVNSISGVSIPAGYHNGNGIAKIPIVAGNTIIYSESTNYSGSSSTPRVVKSVRIEQAGSYRIIFNLTHNSGWTSPVHGEVRVNGTSRYTVAHIYNTFTIYQTDVTLAVGDILALAFYVDWSAVDTGFNWTTNKFEIGCSYPLPIFTKL